jgi:hypothetical protein
VAERRTISKQAVPRTSFRVRRRRYGDARWLVSHNEIYHVDALTDTVWLACTEGLTVEELAHRVADREDLPLAEALAATVGTLELLRERGLIELDEPS